MALSGSFGVSLEGVNRLQGEWTAKQDAATNTSTITLKVYWLGLSGKGVVVSTETNFGYTDLDGVEVAFEASPTLSAGQKKLLTTRTYVAKHDANGLFEDFDMTISFDIDSYVGKVLYGRVSASTYEDLNPIPRESGLISDVNWTAGANKSFNIQQFSTAFTNKLLLHVRNRAGTNILIKALDYGGADTAKATAFTVAENTKIFDTLDGRDTAITYAVLETRKDGTLVGSKTYTGTITAPLASTADIAESFTIGNTFDIAISRENAGFLHTVQLLKADGSSLKEYTGVGAALAFDTASIKDTLLTLLGTADSLPLTVKTFTYFSGELVRTATTKTTAARLKPVPPGFTAVPVHKDTNTVTATLTGNDQFIISKKSTVQVRILAAQRATAGEGSTMKEYVATLAGKTITKPYSSNADVVFEFGTIAAATDQALVIRAVDSRGNSLMVTKNIPVIAYDPPGITSSAGRSQGYDHDTIMTLAGTLSSIEVNGVNKNSLVTARFRTRETPNGVWSGYTNFATAGFPGFTATDAVKYLDRLKAFQIEFSVSDKLSTVTATRSVGSGQPIFMVDDRIGSVGFGDFPNQPNIVMMNMLLKFAANKYGSLGGGIDMNNSDIIGLNSSFFKDHTNSDGEGFHFPYSTFVPTPEQPLPNQSQRDTLRASDGTLLLNSKPLNMPGDRIVWSGGVYPNDGAEIPFGRPLMNFPNGIILAWSEYIVGTGSQDSGFQFTVVPKELYPIPGNGLKVPLLDSSNTLIFKYIYINYDFIGSGASNSSGINRNMVLRYIIGF